MDEVLALAPTVGIPGQNLVVGDSGGRIAWTLLGRVPRGTGPDADRRLITLVTCSELFHSDRRTVVFGHLVGRTAR